MLLRYVTSFSLIFLLFLTSCSTEHSEIVLAKYGNSEIKMAEFEKAYAKNLGSFEQAKKDSTDKLKNFLDLYVNFKMKLRDAEIRGYENDPNLQQELNDYKKQVGVSYILEKEIVEPGIRELHNKRQWELRVSHIMVRPGVDETIAQNKAQAILDSIKNGASFAEMVDRHTDDLFSKTYEGDIFYVTAGQLPAEFEDAAYSLQPGEIYPEVVQTRFGFHIIKLTEKKKRTPQIRASHILITYANNEGKIDTVTAKLKMDSVLTALRNGEDFSEVATRYSEDTGTKAQGGDLGFFERRMMVRQFDEAAFNLEVGEISDVVETNFGLHVIKLTERKEVVSFEEDKENLKKMFKQNWYQHEYDNLINSLKNQYNYSVNQETFDFVIQKSDSVRFGSVHPNYDEIQGKVLFSYSNQNVSVGEFMEKALKEAEFVNKLINNENLTNALNKVGSNYLLEARAMELDKYNPDFAALMEDYKNGIFIFKLQEDEVWNNIDLDSTKLYQHYLDTKEKYTWPDRVDFSEIYVRSDSVAQHIYALLQNGGDFDSLASKYTERAGYKDKSGKHGLQSVNSSKLAETAATLSAPGSYSEPFQSAGGFSIVRLNEFEPARHKTFEEAKAEVSGSFQEAESKRLESEYLSQLKTIYQPKVYYQNLEKAFTE